MSQWFEFPDIEGMLALRDEAAAGAAPGSSTGGLGVSGATTSSNVGAYQVPLGGGDPLTREMPFLGDYQHSQDFGSCGEGEHECALDFHLKKVNR